MHAFQLCRITKTFAGFLLIGFLYQIDAQRPDEQRGITLALGNIAAELGRVHCLLSGHIAKGPPIIAENDR